MISRGKRQLPGPDRQDTSPGRPPRWAARARALAAGLVLLGAGALPVTAAAPARAATSGTFAYIANAGSNTVSVINAATDTVTTTIPVGLSPFAVAFSPGGTRAYVTNTNSSNVSVIDTATDTVTTLPFGTSPRGVATTRVPVVATATCPAGHVITGGGYQQSGGAVPPVETTSRPVGNTWQILADNQNTNYTNVTPYAVCAP
ncbi:hypothetical protein GCM10010430_73390 [Kitasatospora cystarginea]|uniref:40-residue YVTN family beta-propeller repeat-containing protein n=1 Tax=Kitasatospora cystarginea TaxID=58350 RepID=A0ABP5RUX6_9ACTN